MTPLLLAALPGWLVYRAARDATDPEDHGHPVGTAWCGVVSGYLLVGTPRCCTRPAANCGPTSSTRRCAAVFAAGAAACGVWAAHGCARGPLPAPLRPALAVLPRVLRAHLLQGFFVRDRTLAVLRAGAAGAVALVGGVRVPRHGGAAFLRGVGDGGVRAGHGCAVGAVRGAAAGPRAGAERGGVGRGVRPRPRLRARRGKRGDAPGRRRGPGAADVPAAGGGARGGARGAARVGDGGGAGGGGLRGGVVHGPVGGARLRGARRGLVAGAHGPGRDGCGGAVRSGHGGARALAGGPMGAELLAEFGPVWWRTGAAAVAWTLPIALPTALLLRAWRLRKGRDTAGGGAEGAEVASGGDKRRRKGPGGPPKPAPDVSPVPCAEAAADPGRPPAPDVGRGRLASRCRPRAACGFRGPGCRAGGGPGLGLALAGLSRVTLPWRTSGPPAEATTPTPTPAPTPARPRPRRRTHPRAPLPAVRRKSPATRETRRGRGRQSSCSPRSGRSRSGRRSSQDCFDVVVSASSTHV